MVLILIFTINSIAATAVLMPTIAVFLLKTPLKLTWQEWNDQLAKAHAAEHGLTQCSNITTIKVL
jgi:hypothetical protein